MIDKKAKDIFKEIVGLEALLTEDLESWDPRSKPGKITQHAQARNRLAELKKEYERFIINNCAAIFVDYTHPAWAGQFTKLAEEKGGTLTIDSLDMFRVLADDVWDSMRAPAGTLAKQLDFNQIGLLNGRLGAICMSLAFPGYLGARFTKLLDIAFPTKSDLIAALRGIIMAEVEGSLLHWTYVQKQIVDRAFASGATNSPVPCVILNSGEDKATLLSFVFFGDRFVDVKLEGEVVPYTVTKAFNELKKKLKSTTNTDEVSN